MAEYRSDKVFHCKSKSGKPASLCWLLEHKHEQPAFPHMQIGGYIFDKWRTDQKAWEKHTGPEKAAKGDERPPETVIALVIYHGKKGWAYREAPDCIPDLPPNWRPYIPNFKYYVIDLSQLSNEEILALRRGYLVNALLVMKNADNRHWLMNNLDKVLVYGDYYRSTEEGRLFIYELLAYYFKVSDIRGRKQVEQVSQKLPENMTNLIQSGWAFAIEEGKEIGIKIGHEKGVEEGMEKGMEKGEAQKARLVILRLLAKFPAMSDAEIAELADEQPEFVREVRMASRN
jgi:hypothetical protein